MAEEIESQPGTWRQGARLAASLDGILPAAGQRGAVAGCGASWFMAPSYAGPRGGGGRGGPRPHAARVFIRGSGPPAGVLQLRDRGRGRPPTVAIVGDPGTPIARLADQV